MSNTSNDLDVRVGKQLIDRRSVPENGKMMQNVRLVRGNSTHTGGSHESGVVQRFVLFHLNLPVLTTAVQQPQDTGEAPGHVDPRHKKNKEMCRM